MARERTIRDIFIISWADTAVTLFCVHVGRRCRRRLKNTDIFYLIDGVVLLAEYNINFLIYAPTVKQTSPGHTVLESCEPINQDGEIKS